MPHFTFGSSGGISGHGWGAALDLPQAPTPGNLEDVFITAVDIRFGQLVDSIMVTYRSKSTGATFLSRAGGSGGASLGHVPVARNQIISRITGFYGVHLDSISIDVRDLGTGNVLSFGPFGGPGGSQAYEYDTPNLPGVPADTQIIGFWGVSGEFIDSIGVILRRPL